MVSIENLTVEFGGFTLLDHISFIVNKKERVALVGKNGAGKSTLLKIIARLQQPSSGQVTVPKDSTVGYLPQQMEHNNTRTVREEAEQAFAHIIEIQQRINRIGEEISLRTDYESTSYHRKVEELTIASEELAMLGGMNYHALLEKTLTGLGFSRSDFDRATGEFSGGWRMRIELAKILLLNPDVLLLDEPTNHLDIESIQWLENFLATSGSALLLVSHDKAFLDSVTSRTVEISLGHIYDYRVPYSQYTALREEAREQQMRAYKNQQKQIQDTEKFIERFRYKSSKAIQVQSRIKQLSKLKRIEIDDEDNALLNLRFPPAPNSGNYPVIIEKLAKYYGDYLVFENTTFTVNRGDKIAFVGKNGAGKSTLVKCIMGETDYSGVLTLGHNVKIGYFAQNQAQLLNENLSVFDTVDYVAQGDIRTKIRDILGAFMFGGEATEKKVKVLSGGERSRLAMIRLLLEPANLQILDEPTNHLDMHSKNVLKQAIKKFDGTVVVVSHDRDFLDGLVNKVYEFGNKQVKEHLGGIYDFLQKKRMENLQELEINTKQSNIQSHAPKPETAVKLSYEEQKEQNRRKKRLKKQLSDSENQITQLEQQVSATEMQLTLPENNFNPELLKQYNELKNRLSKEIHKWEKLYAEDI
ncbi:MAG: ABC-F family ATP-binding cassette domain-containing protein [Bacteroidales bacterium]|jgi:ATP-binding cassette subfamily F protein 3|nr:ABC-F family ATP-binding cassette domain-containing protein [Bacteroidales bacterium]